VIGKGDEIHASGTEPLVSGNRLRIAGSEADLAKKPLLRAIAMFGVDVKVGFHAGKMAAASEVRWAVIQSKYVMGMREVQASVTKRLICDQTDR
jgi:hypothetical protein